MLQNELQKTLLNVRSYAAPTSVSRASTMQTYIKDVLLKLMRLKTTYRNRIAKLEARRDQEVKRFVIELFARARAQEQFALANRDTLFKHNAEFALSEGGSMQLRETAASVKFDDLDDEAAVAALKEAGAPDNCVNYRPTVHKTNLKKAIEDNPKLQAKLEVKGFRFENGLMFTLNFSGCEAKLKHNAEHPELPFVIDIPKEKEKGVTANNKAAST